MTVSQAGRFRHGTFGFPVRLKLSDRENISLSAATAISLSVYPPNKTTALFTRDIGLAAIFDNVVGILQWSIQNGDMPVAGTYTATVTIDFEVGRRLIVDGKFSVE